jgi:3-hydroxyisobutyrate dehydrogenase
MLPADRLIDILSDTSGAPAAMKGRGALIAKSLAGVPRGPAAFALSAAKKDLATAIQFAKTLNAELPVAAGALACFEQAEAAGLGEEDATTMSTYWPQQRAKSKS